MVVRFFDDEHVGSGIGPDFVAPQLERTHGFIDPHIEDGGVVVGPRAPVRGVRDRLARLSAGDKVAETHGVPLAARGVGRIDEPPVIRADREVAESEVVVPFGEEVLVEEDHFGILRSVDRASAVDPVTAPLDRPGEVEPWPLSDRDRQIGLLDPGHHLGIQRLLERDRAGHGCFGVGVFGLEVSDDGWVVFVPEPEPVVGPHVAVGFESNWAPGRHRGGCRSSRMVDLRGGVSHMHTMARPSSMWDQASLGRSLRPLCAARPDSGRSDGR